MRIQRTARISLAATIIIVGGCGGGGGGYGGGSGQAQVAAPTATITAPSSATLNRTVQLTANATAGAGVNRVEFLVDGTVIASDTTAPYDLTWDTSTVADGSHSLTARTVDSANASATSTATTVTVLNSPVIDVAVSATEVFPRTNSTATGAGQLTFNLVTGAVTGGVTLTGITATLAHIHSGIAGTNGPVLVDFVQSASDANRWDSESGGTLTAAQVDALLAGQLYVNVHSAAFPGGEIRGQIKPQGIAVAVAGMAGGNVVPAVTNSATGFAAMTEIGRAHV